MCTSYFLHISWFFFFIFGDLELRHFLGKMPRGRLVCVICNSNSFHSFIFKLLIMIVTQSTYICTYYFVHIWYIFSGSVGLKIFYPSEMLRGCLVCVICNSNSFHSLIFKLRIMIVYTLNIHLHLLFCAYLIYIFLFLGLLDSRHFIHLKCLGGVWFV